MSEGQAINYSRGGGRYKMGGGGSVKFTLTKKMWGGGAEKVLAMLKGGTTSFEVVLTHELEVLAILKGVQKASSLYKEGRGGKIDLPVLRGGGCNTFQTPNFLSFSTHPPFPVIND